MASYTNYAQGIKDSGNGTYNLQISGGSDYNSHSGIYLGGVTALGNAGLHMYQNASKDAYIDLLANSTNQLGFRYTANGSTFSNMLSLMNDNLSGNSTNAASVSGRVAASQFFVDGSQNDTRAPVNQGLYVATSSTGGQFKVNPGASGTAGFSFTSYDRNGNNAVSNLVLKANGVVQASAGYSVTSDQNDIIEQNGAVAGFDMSGNLIRNYAINGRIRAVENSLSTISSDLTSGLASKVNELITRLNGLNFYNNNIAAYNLLGAPVIASVTKASSTSVTVVINKVTGALSYKVTASNGVVATANDSGSATTSITVTGLTQGGNYTFIAQSVNDSGTSVASANSASVTLP